MVENPQPDDLVEFTVEDQLELLRSNTLALAAGTIAFLRSRAIPATEWTAYLGEVFARGWDTAETWSPEDFLESTIVSLGAFGGEAIQAEFGDDDASAVIARFPDLERLSGLGLDGVDVDLLFDLIGPIATACGIAYEWWRTGDQIRIEVSPLASR